MVTSDDLPPRDDPIKLLLGDVDVEAIRGGIATVVLGANETMVVPQVWVIGRAKVNNTEVELEVQLHVSAGRARLIAQRMIECAYLAENHQPTTDPGRSP